ncbi:MAG TPA: DUF1905 domain-containing protein [Solirubrobacterales bacterium]|nr:DUF1905 domain-containing protein [Solirubrobacterales bacterium]
MSAAESTLGDGSYEFTAELWLYTGEAAWHFISLPPEVSDDVRARTEGLLAFGSAKVEARIGETTWPTSVFFDRKRDCFLLPVKAEVRRREGIDDGDRVRVRLALSGT